MSTYPEQTIMVASTSVNRTVYNVKPHIPNRYAEQGYAKCLDEVGIISLEGKRVEVQTAFRGDVLVWELVGSGPTWPHCEKDNMPLYIDIEMEWRCGQCEQERIERLRIEHQLALES